MLDTVYAIGDASSKVHSLSYMVYISTFQVYLRRKEFHFELFNFFFKSFLSQVLSKIYWRMHAEVPRVPTTSFQSLILLILSTVIQLSGVF